MDNTPQKAVARPPAYSPKGYSEAWAHNTNGRTNIDYLVATFMTVHALNAKGRLISAAHKRFICSDKGQPLFSAQAPNDRFTALREQDFRRPTR